MKKILCVLLVVIMCLTAAPLGGFAELDLGITASALDATGKCGENANYTFDSATGKLVISGTGKIYADAFRENIEIKNIIIGDNITKVSAGAFDLCCNLESVCFGDSITEIEYFGFGACSSLTVVALSKDLTIIGDKAFQYCSNLERVILFDNVTSINYQAFFDCFSLESINIPKKVAHIGEGTFRNCYALTDIYYEGSEDEWNKIDIGEKNTGLYNATIHYNATMPYNCEHKNPTIVYKVQPTCINNGMKAHYFCSECNSIVMPSGESYKLYINGITIPALGHDMEEVAAKEATCKEAGNNKYYACDRCDKFFKDEAGAIETTVEAETIAKGEHKFTKYNVVKDATCEANAVEKATCDVCEEATHERPIPGTMLAHTFKDYKSDGNATCKADGTMTAVCEMCKEAKDTKTEVDSHKNAPHTPDAAGVRCTLCGEMLVCLHTYSAEKLITKTPTCTTEGQKAIVCSKCKANKPGSEEVIPAAGHAYKKTTYPVTCISDGYDLYQCQNCNYGYKDNWVTDRQHNYTETRKEATCTAAGLITYICATCGDRKDDLVIPALGHVMDYYQTIPPTCTEKGIKHGSCLNCSYTEEIELKPLGHFYDIFDGKYPTCTEAGYYIYCCRDCDVEGYREDVPATGHSYPDNWSVVIAPDCQNTGFAVKVCFSCHDVIAQKVPKAGHADLDGDSKCDTCNKEIVVTEPEEPTDPDTPNEPEEKPCDCDCHVGGIKAFFFKLINFFAKIFDKSARVCECGKSH